MSLQSKHYLREFVQILLGKERQDTLRSHLVRGASGTFALKIASTGLVFITSLVLARILWAKGYGAYVYAISWVYLLSVPAVMGLPTLLIREVARYKAQENWGVLRGILRWSDQVVLIVSLGLMLLAAGVVWLLGGHLEPQIAVSLWIAILMLFFFAFVSLRQGAMQGLGHVIAAQLPQMLVLPILFLILVGGLHFAFDLNASSAIGMRVLAIMIAFLVGAGLLKKYLPSSVKEALPDYHTREWRRSMLPLLFVSTLGTIDQQISIIMVGSMLGFEAAGIFDVARRGAMLVSFVLMAVNMPLAPTVARLYARGEKERLQRIVTKSARVVLFGSLPIALGLMIFGHWVLLIFGREFTGGSAVLAILCSGQIVNAGMGSVGLLLNMTGHERDTARGVGIAATVNVALNAILIPLWGIEGAAIATSTSLIIWNIILLMRVREKLGLNSLALGKIRKKEDTL